MSRPLHKPASVSDLAGFVFSEPVTFSFPLPTLGGPRLTEIRKALASVGKVRFSSDGFDLDVNVDPGSPEEPVIALDCIVRSDATGLERMILSALPHVDEIVIGVDGRSDEDTVRVAEAYGDVVHRFYAKDIGLSDEEWAADRIHFANARNKGRTLVKAPWSLFLDSDEYVFSAPYDIRSILKGATPDVGAFGVDVELTESGAIHKDAARLARASYRWWRATHNQLLIEGAVVAPSPSIFHVKHDTSLRAKKEVDRRTKQRREGVHADLTAEAEKGELTALWHLAKQKLGDGDETGVKDAEEYRFRTEVLSDFSNERAWMALGCAALYYNKKDWIKAYQWAVRALLDGPRIDAMCLLGDVSEQMDKLGDAYQWYEAACAITDHRESSYTPFGGLLDERFDRLRSLKESYESAKKRSG